MRCGDLVQVFTRLERAGRDAAEAGQAGRLDTLVHASVARSRSEALAWCVRLVGQHEADWLAELREAMQGRPPGG